MANVIYECNRRLPRLMVKSVNTFLITNARTFRCFYMNSFYDVTISICDNATYIAFKISFWISNPEIISGIRLSGLWSNRKKSGATQYPSITSKARILYSRTRPVPCCESCAHSWTFFHSAL